jgi:hypothetical protein
MVPPGTMAYSATISLEMSSVMSAIDIANISSQLGLTQQEILRQCRVGFNGMLIASEGTTPVESNQNPTTKVGYNGAVTNVMLNPYVACASAPHPGRFANIQQFGNAFGITMGSAFCTPSNPGIGNVSQILIHHQPSGTDTCTIR